MIENFLKIENWKLKITLTITCFFLPAIVSAATLTKPPTNLGLVGYWSFNEGTSTSVGDFSGNGNNSTTTNMASPPTSISGWANGKRGSALNFDGSNDYVYIGANDTLFPDNQPITISAWIYPRTTGGLGNNFGRIVSRELAGQGPTLKISSDICFNCVSFQVAGGTPFERATAENSIPFNTWSHVIVTWDGSITAANSHIYINGVEASYSVTTDGASITDNSSAPLVIGNRISDLARQYDGLIDEVRIYNRTLSATEVTGLYKTGAVSHKVPNNLGLVAYWPFNEGTSTKASDFSNNNNTGNLFGFNFNPGQDSGWTDGKFGKALIFSRAFSNKVEPGKSLLSTSDSAAPFTISTWIKTSDGVNQQTIISQGITGDAGRVALKINVPGNLTKVSFQQGGSDLVLSTAIVTNGIWHLITATKDASKNVILYVDSVSQGSVSNNSAYSATTTIVGSDWNGDIMNGKVDDVRIYNRALSSDEVATLYQGSKTRFINSSQNTRITNGLVGLWSFNGADVDWSTNRAFDRSGNNNTGIMTNMSTTTSPTRGKVNQAINCAGAGYIDIGVEKESNFDFTSAVAVSAWVKIPAYSKSFEAIIAKGDNAWRLARSSTNSYLEWATNGTSALLLNGTINLADNLWHHVVATYDGSRSSIYVDGVVDTSVSNTGSVTTNNIQVSVCENLGAAGRQWGGLIDEVRVYNRGLSAQEIKQLYLMGK
jgi:hypothetical protein